MVPVKLVFNDSCRFVQLFVLLFDNRTTDSDG